MLRGGSISCLRFALRRGIFAALTAASAAASAAAMTAAARLDLAALSCALSLRRTGRTRRFRRVGIFVVRLILPRGAALAVFLGAAVGTLTASAVCLLAALRLFAAAFCILFLGFGLFATLCMALAAASAAAMSSAAAAGAALSAAGSASFCAGSFASATFVLAASWTGSGEILLIDFLGITTCPKAESSTTFSSDEDTTFPVILSPFTRFTISAPAGAHIAAANAAVKAIFPIKVMGAGIFLIFF